MLTKKEVENVARLAHLELKAEEKETFTSQLAKIIEYVDKLNELDTQGVQPTAYTVPMKNVLRKDELGPSMARDKALANAPAKKDGQFQVPRIISE